MIGTGSLSPSDEICQPRTHLAAYRWVGNGCPPKDRLALCKAFIAKAVWDLPTTRDLIDAVGHRPEGAAKRRRNGYLYHAIYALPG